MFPAARIGDPISHDLVTPGGVVGPPADGMLPTVIIEGSVAAPAGSMAVCSGALTAGLAHPPGIASPVLVGAPTVIVGGKPLLRWAPAPDVTGCGAMIGSLALAPTRTVLIGP